MEAHERRRVVLATAFTLVALPAIWLFDRDEPTVSPGVAAAGVPTPEVASVAGPEADVADTEPEIPIFLENTVVVVAPAVIDVALPDAPGDDELQGSASFKRFDPLSDRKCAAPGVPPNTLITVTNINNGLSITCRSTNGVSVPYGITVAIDTDLFVEIADLVSAPVPVRVSW